MESIRQQTSSLMQAGRFPAASPASWSYQPEPVERRHALPARNAALEGLAGSSVADRFRSWQGSSGRRYIFSVFALDPWPTLLDRVPTDGEAVVIAVRRGEGRTRTPLWIGQTDGAPEAFLQSARVKALAEADCELHLHLLGQGPAERDAIVRDLLGEI